MTYVEKLAADQFREVVQLTPKVSNEVVKLHLAFGLDVGIMQVSVEHNDSKRNQENSVCRLEPWHFVSIAVAVAARKRLQANRFILLNITQTNWFYRSFWSLASDNQWPPFDHLLPLVPKPNFWGNWHAKCLPVTRQSLSKHWTKHAINPWFTDAPTLVWGGGIKVLSCWPFNANAD